MTSAEIDALFQHNVDQLSKMNVAAAGLVSALLSELERQKRHTYIRLKDAAPRGHKVNYEFVAGDRRLVSRLARALGFKSVTESSLEVRSAK